MTLRDDVRDGLRLPLDALRLLGRRWPEVLAWAVGGFLVHQLLVRGAAAVALGDLDVALNRPTLDPIAKGAPDVDAFHRAVGFAMLGLAALATLVMTVGVFSTLRRDLPLRVDEAGKRVGGKAARFHHTLALTLAPFLGFYAGWGLLDQDQGQYVAAGRTQAVDLLDITVDDIGWWMLGATLVLFLAKALLGLLARRSGFRPLTLVESVFEATYLFLAVFALTVLLTESRGWIETRVFWAWLVDGYRGLVGFLPDMIRVAIPEVVRVYAAAVGTVLGQLKDAVVQPLVWLAIALIAYQHIDTSASEPTEQRPTGRTQTRTMAAARMATRGVREKYVAFVSATRAALLAGLVPFLFFCVWYLAVDVVVGWSWPLLARHVIGPHDFLVYSLFDDWRRLGQDTLTYALRLPLLAAGFALVTRRLRARGTAAW